MRERGSIKGGRLVARIGALLCGALIALAAGPGAAADGYPDRPVHLVVAYPAGGAVDYVARVVAQHLGDRLGRRVIVDNRAGAAGGIGFGFVAAAKPDGYTLLMDSVTNRSIVGALQKQKTDVDLGRDMMLVASVGLVPFVLVVNPSLPITTPAEFLAYAKAPPRPMFFGSTGVGSSEHLGIELLKLLTGVDVHHVPYTGGAPAVTDLVGGQIDGMVMTVPTAMPFLSTKQLRPIMLAMPSRLAELPDVPAASEAGLPDFQVAALYGVVASAKLDPAIAQKLNRLLVEVVALPEFTAAMRQSGIIARGASLADSAALFQTEIKKWSDVVQRAGIKIEGY